jgi:crotonobetainyl-CoA:carnitine CoA-transferase CaiB-like acyl-CoA transferase
MSDNAPGSSSKPPLEGIVVADFSRVLAGPLASMLLGDLGAEVIKIERPGKGDETRSWGPPLTDDGQSAYYLAINRNKQSITLDLNDEKQCALARDIALSSDVVIENFRADTMQGFGLDYNALKADNPGIVYCRVSGFGNQLGRSLPGYDFIAQALSGFMSITGERDGRPTKTGVAIVDVLTGLHASIGILAALFERRRTGVGQRIEVNLFSSALASLVNQASSYLTNGTVPTRIGNQHPSIVPYETFATATAPIVIAVGTERQFRSLCDVLDLPHVAGDARWTTNADRVSNRDALVEALETSLRKRPDDYWLQELRKVDVPCSPINDIRQAFELAEQLNLDAIQALVRDDGASVPTVSNPIAFSRTPVSYRRAPPKLGADNDGVLEWLARITGRKS